jgi:hypothetical protein
MSTPYTCSLSVVLASDAPVAVIFRKGPTRWVQVIKWDTLNDTFEPGQWFNGRIYTEYCSVSPDGTLLQYLAMAAHWSRGNSNETGEGHISWVAVSKIPWLTALVFNSTGLRGAVGRIVDNETAHVGYLVEVKFPERPRVAVCEEIKGRSWDLEGSTTLKQTLDGYVMTWRDGRGELLISNASWAGWDQMGHLIYLRGGSVLRGEIIDGQLIERELANFDDGRHPDPQPLPEWARRC